MWASRRRTAKAAQQLWARARRSQPLADWRATALALGRATLITALGVASFIATCDIYDPDEPAPHFPLPAMAVLALCFEVDRFTLAQPLSVRRGNATQSNEVLVIVQLALVLGLSIHEAVLARYALQRWRRLSDKPVLALGVCATLLHLVVFASSGTGYVRLWSTAQKFMDQGTKETEWSFGQLVPMFLLIGPILTFIGGLAGTPSLRLTFCSETLELFQPLSFFCYPTVVPRTCRPSRRSSYTRPYPSLMRLAGQ